MLLTLWALRWCWVGMLAVVAYLRHAVSRECVESRHALLRSAYRVMAECRRSATMSADVGGDGDDVAVMMLCRRVGDALFSVTPFV